MFTTVKDLPSLLSILSHPSLKDNLFDL